MRKIFLFWVVLLFTFFANAQPIIEIDDRVSERNLMPYEIAYFIDSTNNLSFEEISSSAYRYQFRPIPI